MKRIFALIVISMTATAFASAQSSFSFTLNGGYMYQVTTTTYDKSSLAAEIQAELNDIFKDSDSSIDVTLRTKEQFNAGALGLNMQGSSIPWFPMYFSLTAGIPTSMATAGFNPTSALYDRTLNVHSSSDVKAVILDGQLGLGFAPTLSRLTLLFGLGATANYVNITRSIDKPLQLKHAEIVGIKDSSQSVLLGLGATLKMGWMFTDNFGLTASVNYSCYLIPAYRERHIEGSESKTGALINYKLTSKSSLTDVKEPFAHNVSILLGFTLAVPARRY